MRVSHLDLVHLAKNHPLPDGNKRAAWVAMRLDQRLELARRAGR